MPKVIKGNAGRKPPEPSTDHAEIEQWLRRQMPDLQPVLRQLDELIRSTVPDLRYAVKWKRAFYGLPDRGWIIELAGYDISANVFFLGGADFDAPPPLGSADRVRYVKVNSVDDADRPELRDWIAQASRTAGWR